jgi:hypothetical protein
VLDRPAVEEPLTAKDAEIDVMTKGGPDGEATASTRRIEDER